MLAFLLAAFDDWFLVHPRDAGETYFQHLYQAACILLRLILACFSITVHALVPKLLPTATSQICGEIARSVQRRHAAAEKE